MNATLHEVAAAGEETTAYTIGYTIGKLLNVKRMVELNYDELGRPLFTKDEITTVLEEVINKLGKVTYPYKV